jgi:hypothetical protein
VKTYPVRHAISAIAFTVAAISISAQADSILARQRPKAAPPGAARAKDNELYQREMALKRLGENARNSSRREPVLALKQIKEDFESLQAVNNNMMRDCSREGALDFKRISEATTEINRRARRLKANLAMSVGDADKKDQKKLTVIEGEHMKATLIKLDTFIMSFVTSPLFQNPQVLDAQLSAQASSDLARIIELSHSISKSAGRLRKKS